MTLSKYIIRLLLSLSFALSFSSCNDVKLGGLSTISGQPNQKSFATANVNFCTTPGAKAKSLIKFIFLVDHSGSNQQNYDSQGNQLPGTDTDGSRRFAPLIAFVNTLPTDADNSSIYSFDMIDFSGSSADVTGGFITGTSNIVTALLNEQNALGTDHPNDSGWTDYIGAETLAYTNILNDINAAKASGNRTSTAYILFHITDGQPIVNQVVQPTNAILGTIANILALQTANKDFVDTIQYNTAYYYNTLDSGAVTLLKAMAAGGNGSYYEFGSGAPINYKDFALPDTQSRHLFQDIYVLNLNTAWDNNAKLGYSSAGDGVLDTLKPANPSSLDEDENGLSDLAELRLSNQVCADADCQVNKSINYDLKCAGFLTSATGADRFFRVFPGGLNQCEAYELGGDATSWHSSLLPVPDSLLTRAGLSIAIGTNSANRDSFSDNTPNYLKIKLNAPVNFATTSVPGLTLQNYNVKQTSTNAQQDCYAVTVNNISTILTDGAGKSLNNTLGVWEIESDATTGNNYYLRYGMMPVANGTATFGDADLSSKVVSAAGSAGPPNIVTTGLNLELDAAQGTSSLTFAGVGCAALSWFDLSSLALDSNLQNFSNCGFTHGWNGIGSNSDPFRLDFDATQSTYVTLPNGLLNGTSYSLEIWFNTTSTGALIGNQSHSFGAGGSSSYNPVAYIDTNGILRAGIYESSSIPVVSTYSSAPVNDGRWHQLILTGTHSGIPSQSLYLDGGYVNSYASADYDNSEGFYQLGVGLTGSWTAGNGTSFYYTGSISRVNVYNQVLSPAQIIQNCQASAGRFANATCR